MSELPIYLVSDGKPGHLSQSRGLAEALGRRRAVSVRELVVGQTSASDVADGPGVVLAAGRLTHGLAVRVGGRVDGPTVVMMDPGWWKRWRFDLCVIPRHDGVAESPRVVVTEGALNTVRAATGASGDEGLLLIGGPSKHHGWDEAGITAQLRRVVEADASVRWTATSSRRTPASTVEALHGMAAGYGDRLRFEPADRTPPGWVAERLGRCGVCWVSEDSVSMVYEALTAGARVGLLDVPVLGGGAGRVGGGRVGGAVAGLVERGTVEVSRALVEAGHRSVVVSSGGRLVAELTGHGAEHVEMAIHRKSPVTLVRVGPLRRLVREMGVDVLHARSRVPAWVGYLAWRRMAERDRPAFVTSVHGLYSVNRYSRVMTFGQRVEVVSETVRDYVLRSYPAVDAGKLVLNHRGVDPAAYPFGYRPSEEWLSRWRAGYPELEGRFVIVLAGRITRLKGHHDLLAALAALRGRGIDAHALIVGDEDPRRRGYAEEVRAAVRQRRLEGRVTFTGHRSDIREVLAVSGVVVSLSTQPESFGRSVLEAVRLGRPVVGYDHGGVGEVLAEVYPAGRTPLGDLGALVDRLAAVASGGVEPPKRTEAFPLSAMLERSVGMYEEVAGYAG